MNQKIRASRVEPQLRRRLLIEATLRCLATRGTAGATVENICREAGVSKGLLNHHFQGKSDIIVQTYHFMSEQMAEETQRILGDFEKPAEDLLAAMIEVSFRPPILTRDAASVWLSLWGLARTDPTINENHKRVYTQYRLDIATLIAKVAAQNSVHVNASRAALALTTMIDGLWLEWCIDPDAFVPQEGEAVCKEFVQRLFNAAPSSAAIASLGAQTKLSAPPQHSN